MSKKRILLIAAACFLMLGTSFGATYAYLISDDTEINAFTVGETVIEVKEEYTPPDKLTPGDPIPKKPWVENTGNLPCFVRMRADFSDSRAEAFCEKLDINTTDWYYDSADGYYYYKKLLNKGEKTSALFTKVQIKSDTNQEDIIDFDVLVYAEARQQGEYPASDWKTAWGKEGATDAG